MSAITIYLYTFLVVSSVMVVYGALYQGGDKDE